MRSLNLRWCLPLLITLSIAMTTETASGGTETPELYSDLLFSDLIVRGRVTAVKNEGVPVHEFDPDWQGPDGYFGILFIDVDVDEVLRGYWNSPQIRFAVHADTEDLRGEYETGDEVVVGLLYMPRFRNGTYTLNMRNARFLKRGSLWAPGGNEQAAVPLEEIRSVIAPTTLSSLGKAAESVVIARVASVDYKRLADPDNPNNTSLVSVLTVQVERVIKGALTLGQHKVRCFVGGTYWPQWAGRGPKRIKVGETYCLLLTSFDHELTVMNGANGLYEVGEDQTLKHNELSIPVKVSNLPRMVEE